MDNVGETDLSYVHPVNDSIRRIFRDAMALKGISILPYLSLTFLRQRAAARRRLRLEAQGVHVPPFMIVSVTDRCNLACAGCYARAHGRAPEKELSTERLDGLFAEAEELGTSIVMLAGGEPLLREDLLDITARHPGLVFPLFTNGTLITDGVVEALHDQRQVVPVLSMEGLEEQTDERRGEGVYRIVTERLDALREAGVFAGASLTVTSRNLDLVTSDRFVQGITARGARLLFYVEYVPIRQGTEALVPSAAQREALDARLADLHAAGGALYVAFPGDEKKYGGCLAAGRGFVHVSADGRLEPCPMAPYSDTSLRDLSLREALGSDLLRKIRGSREHLQEAAGGCALWEHREWVQSLLGSREESRATA